MFPLSFISVETNKQKPHDKSTTTKTKQHQNKYNNTHTHARTHYRPRCISYGVLPHNEAKRLFKVVLDRKKSGRGSAISSPSPVKRKPKKAKILKDDAHYDADFVVSGGGDGIGTMTL